MSAMTVEAYQERWDATGHDCVLCWNRGYYAELGDYVGNGEHVVTGYAVCGFEGCMAGALLPPALRRKVEDGTIEGGAV